MDKEREFPNTRATCGKIQESVTLFLADFLRSGRTRVVLAINCKNSCSDSEQALTIQYPVSDGDQQVSREAYKNSDKVMESKVRFLSLPVLWWHQDFQNLLPNHNAEMTGVRDSTASAFS